MALLLVASARLLSAESLSGLEHSLQQLAIDPQETYRVRDVRLRKGDVSIYLNEGVLSFATPVGGRIVAALFTTKPVDAGDAEILLLPPQAAERASLASFAKTPNMDQHFDSAVFFFSDDTRNEVLSQIGDSNLHRSPESAAQIADAANSILRVNAPEVETRLLRSLLRESGRANDFFVAVVLGRQTGPFSFLYDPSEIEPVLVGATLRNPSPEFQLWASYRPRGLPPYQPGAAVISGYRIEASIGADLSLQADATFTWRAGPSDGRAVDLLLSRKLKVESATLDGTPVEFVHRYDPDFEGEDSDSDLLLASPRPVTAGESYQITVHYSGFVIRQVSGTSYLVGERSAWYPHSTPMLTTFDLTFHCPEHFDLVASGELVSNQVSNGIRTIHHAATSSQQLAGFNLGAYRSQSITAGDYRIECYSTEAADLEKTAIPQESADILQKYSAQWPKLPIHTLAITPVPGYFGQGFPGLIYLSETAYVSPESRPADVRNARAARFFADVLLPHEIAHQWWGNMVGSLSYRSEWLFESMANYSALELMEARQGRGALDAQLEEYRSDLLRKSADGSTIESAGPLNFGTRLVNTHGQDTWLVIIYEKGSWVLHMLRERLGADRFHAMQLALLNRYAGKSITNEEFRETVSEFVPPGQPDFKLTSFFETWVYGTGLPVVQRNRGTISVTNVDEDFTFDMPLDCKSADGAPQMRWLHLTEGDNQIPGDMGNCQLPSPAAFLYAPHDSKP